MSAPVKPIEWRDRTLILLDQRLLPHREEYVTCDTVEAVAEAIRNMTVRGAPAIGVAAAYGVVLSALNGRDLERDAQLLKAARPTAVNLAWAVDRMLARVPLALRARPRDGGAPPTHDTLAEPAADLEAEARAIHEEDIAANRRIGAYGQELLGASATVLTHCNAGALATGGYGTALGVIRSAVEQGKRIAVFADETRPWLQGARLTAWELQRENIDVTLIADNMAGHFFQQGAFDAVIVGADRIARNGDVANKIGTYTVAVLAAAHGVPFYVAAPWSTVDLACASGRDIPIEERAPEEVLQAKGADAEGRIVNVSVAPAGVASRHPAFDVTPSRLVTAIITDRGVATAPYEESLASLAQRRADL